MKRFISVVLTAVLLLGAMGLNVFAGVKETPQNSNSLPSFDDSKTIKFKYDSTTGKLSNGTSSVNAYMNYDRIIIKDTASNIEKLFKSLEELNCTVQVVSISDEIIFIVKHNAYISSVEPKLCMDSIFILERSFSGTYKLLSDGVYRKIIPNEPVGTTTEMYPGIQKSTFDIAFRFVLENLYFKVNYNSDGTVEIGMK